MEKIISIIIPSYNMELYLGRCLNSLAVPNICRAEIIIVNDGSKDTTLQIANEFRERYPNSVTVIDKENGNYGSCINAGLRIARGKYVKVLDADDYFDAKVFNEYIEQLTTLDSDVVLTNFNNVESDTLKTYYGRDLRNVRFPTFQSVDFKTASHLLEYPLMHLITYKRKLLKDINYRQTEGASYTDTEWCFIPFASAKSFTFLPVFLYQYIIGREGQTVSKESWLKSNPSYFKIIRNMVEEYSLIAHHLNKSQKSYLDSYLNTVYLSVLQRNMNSKDANRVQEFQKFERRMSEQFPEQFAKWTEIPLSRWSKWKIVKHWRDSDYSLDFSIPDSVLKREQIHKRLYKIIRKLTLF